MKALCFAETGPPEQVLQLRDLPATPLGKNQVRVRMRLAPVNPSDQNYIRGTYGLAPSSFPAIPGFEGLGEVVEARGLLGRFLLRKRVCVLADRQGTWADEVVVDAKRAIPLPAFVPDEQGAVYFINPATAFLLTRRVHTVARGAWLLQTGGTSQVGRMVIRLGRHFGFRTLSLVRSAASIDELRRLGGDACVVHDPASQSAEELAEQVAAATGGAPLRHAIDCVGGAVGSRVLRLLSPGGRLVVYGTMSDAPLEVPSRVLMTADRILQGFWLGPWMARQSLVGKLLLLRELSRLHRAGLFQAEIAGTYPFSAWEQVAERFGGRGKVLLRPDP